VLLKPEADCTSQLIVRGRVVGKLESARFREDREQWLDSVLESFHQLCDSYDVVVVEGAGSPAEPNLREGDIANMGFAEAADIPVWLAGDIDCGGVFAQLTGTLAILSESERARVQAFVINRFRGHLALLEDGLQWLETRTGKPVAGVIPWLDLELPEEDAPYRHVLAASSEAAGFNIAVIAYPRMSNSDDIDPLAAEPAVSLRFVRKPAELQPADLVILPGSKHVAADLEWLRQTGFVEELERHLRYGGRILGICGGMQMLGREIVDTVGVESAGSIAGLGWLDMVTTMQPGKTLKRIDATAKWPKAVPVHGYEIHYGDDQTDKSLFPFSHRSGDGQVCGTYLHGLFASSLFRAAWLAEMGVGSEAGDNHEARIMASLDQLADALEQRIKPELLTPLLGRSTCRLP